MSIPSDETFVKLVESTWQMAEDTQSATFQDKVKQLFGMTRQRLLVLSNNCEEEFKLRQIFKSFDLNSSGNISIEELAGMLAKLGVQVEMKYIQAMF
jgi:hypothetical protein